MNLKKMTLNINGADRMFICDPEKDTLASVLRRLGLTEQDLPRVLMVGDRKFDVQGAAACGIACVGVEFFGYAAPGELDQAGAVAVVRTPEELETYILSH